MKSPSLHISVFSDGRPGHEIQSTSLARSLLSLAEKADVTKDSSSLTVSRFAIRQPWLSFTPRVLPRFGRHILWQGAAPAPDAPADLVITCGRRAAAVGKWYCRQHTAHNKRPLHAHILDPGDSPSRYDYLLLPEHDLKPKHRQHPNIIPFAGSLHPINTNWLEEKAQHWRSTFEPLKKASTPLVGVLIGHPGMAFFEALGKHKNAILRWQPDARFVVTGSHRTPTAAKEKIRQVFAEAPVLWLDKSDGENPYAGMLAWADALAVTADSINMLSEAFATGKPVLPLAVELTSPKHQRFVTAALTNPSATLSVTEKTARSIWDLLQQRQSREG